MPLRFRDQLLEARTVLRAGTHRTSSLEATWRRFAPRARLAGITRLADLTGLDTLGIPVFAAIRPMGRSLSTQQGKGLTPLAAKVSALMESLETWTAEHLELPAITASARELGITTRGSQSRMGVRPTGPPLVAMTRSREQRTRRGVDGHTPTTRALTTRALKPRAATTNAPATDALAPHVSATHTMDVRLLPRPRGRLDIDARRRWVSGFALGARCEVLVPEEAVSLDTTTVVDARPTFDMSSNGLASGNVLVEAIVHGLCEVIERDAEAAWRRRGGDRRIVLDTIPDRACRALVDRIAATGARVFVWDLESDAGLCAIGCAIVEDPREPAWRPLGFYQGFGAHPLPEIAIARALTEAAQTRLTYIAGGRDDFFPFDYERATDPELLHDFWNRLATPCDDPALFDDLPRIEAPTLGTQLEQLLERVGEAIVVDLTHPELQVPVVKVLVPGFATDIEAMG